MNKTITDYISKRYNRWLEYATYQCSLPAFLGNQTDVLDEVFLNFSERIRKKLKSFTMNNTQDKSGIRLLRPQNDKTQYVSLTSPYRYITDRQPLIDANATPAWLEDEDPVRMRTAFTSAQVRQSPMKNRKI